MAEQQVPDDLERVLLRQSLKKAGQGLADKQIDTSVPDKSWLEKIGTPAFAAGAGADWITTAINLAHGFNEDNPTINWAKNPAAMIGLGAAQDIGGYLLARKLLKNHPKLLNAGLLASGALRGGIAARNAALLHGQNKD